MSAFIVTDSKTAEERSKDENRFEFQLVEDGELFSVPKMEFLSRPATKYLSANFSTTSEADLVRGLIEIEAPGAFEAVDAMEDDQALGLSVAWAAASTAEPEGS